MSDSSGFRSIKAGLPLLLAVALVLGACTSNTYMGIPLTGEAGDPALRSLAQRAATGDKRAQLDLGIRYEEGRGVVPDIVKAERLYRLAASDSGGALWIYVPSVKNGQQGRVEKISDSIRQSGLQEARARLEYLKASSRVVESYKGKRDREWQLRK